MIRAGSFIDIFSQVDLPGLSSSTSSSSSSLSWSTSLPKIHRIGSHRTHEVQIGFNRRRRCFPPRCFFLAYHSQGRHCRHPPWTKQAEYRGRARKSIYFNEISSRINRRGFCCQRGGFGNISLGVFAASRSQLIELRKPKTKLPRSPGAPLIGLGADSRVVQEQYTSSPDNCASLN